MAPVGLDTQHYDQAIKILFGGGIVILPTETVYGIAALAQNKDAILRIYALKGRNPKKPPSLSISNGSLARDLIYLNANSQQLIDRFWPGPLTIIGLAKPDLNISDICFGEKRSLGLRQPDTDWAKYFAKVGFTHPLVLTSANLSEQPSPSSFRAISPIVQNGVDFVLDQGPTEKRRESTILLPIQHRFKLVRAGALAPEQLAQYPIDF